MTLGPVCIQLIWIPLFSAIENKNTILSDSKGKPWNGCWQSIDTSLTAPIGVASRPSLCLQTSTGHLSAAGQGPQFLKGLLKAQQQRERETREKGGFQVGEGCKLSLPSIVLCKHGKEKVEWVGWDCSRSE